MLVCVVCCLLFWCVSLYVCVVYGVSCVVVCQLLCFVVVVCCLSYVVMVSVLFGALFVVRCLLFLVRCPVCVVVSCC